MFEMDLYTALLFHRICRLRNTKTEEEKVAVMMYLAKKGRLKSIMQTNRTAEQVAKDFAKNFGNVLHIKSEEKKNVR